MCRMDGVEEYAPPTETLTASRYDREGFRTRWGDLHLFTGNSRALSPLAPAPPIPLGPQDRDFCPHRELEHADGYLPPPRLEFVSVVEHLIPAPGGIAKHAIMRQLKGQTNL
jgi:hypothetical protein